MSLISEPVAFWDKMSFQNVATFPTDTTIKKNNNKNTEVDCMFFQTFGTKYSTQGKF